MSVRDRGGSCVRLVRSWISCNLSRCSVVYLGDDWLWGKGVTLGGALSLSGNRGWFTCVTNGLKISGYGS